MPKSRKLKSHVWDSFKKIDATTARCKICTKTFKHGGNTTNLTQHLCRKHPIKKDTFIATGSKQKIISDTVINKKRRSENEDSSKTAEIQRNVLRPVS